MAKKTKLIFYIYTIGFFTSVILNLFLIPYFYESYGSGINGAAIARSLAYLFIAMLNFYFAFKTTKIRIADNNIIKMLFIGVICFLVVYILKMFFYSLVFVIIISAVFVICYLYLLVLSGVFSRHEREALKDLKSILIRKRVKNDSEKIDGEV